MPNNSNRRRRPAGQRPPRAADPNVLDLDAAAENFEAREPLFTADGVTYTIPVEISAGEALEWLELVAMRGNAAAMVWALAYALGDDGYAALRGRKNLSDRSLATIIDAIKGKFVSAAERGGPKALGTGD